MRSWREIFSLEWSFHFFLFVLCLFFCCLIFCFRMCLNLPYFTFHFPLPIHPMQVMLGFQILDWQLKYLKGMRFVEELEQLVTCVSNRYFRCVAFLPFPFSLSSSSSALSFSPFSCRSLLLFLLCLPSQVIWVKSAFPCVRVKLIPVCLTPSVHWRRSIAKSKYSLESALTSQFYFVVDWIHFTEYTLPPSCLYNVSRERNESCLKWKKGLDLNFWKEREFFGMENVLGENTKSNEHVFWNVI